MIYEKIISGVNQVQVRDFEPILTKKQTATKKMRAFRICVSDELVILKLPFWGKFKKPGGCRIIDPRLWRVNGEKKCAH